MCSRQIERTERPLASSRRMALALRRGMFRPVARRILTGGILSFIGIRFSSLHFRCALRRARRARRGVIIHFKAPRGGFLYPRPMRPAPSLGERAHGRGLGAPVGAIGRGLGAWARSLTPLLRGPASDVLATSLGRSPRLADAALNFDRAVLGELLIGWSPRSRRRVGQRDSSKLSEKPTNDRRRREETAVKQQVDRQ